MLEVFTMDDHKLIIKKQKGEDGYKIFSIRIKDSTLKRIDSIATESGYSRNEIINRFLEFAISHCIIED